jgi:hypothetical protein
MLSAKCLFYLKTSKRICNNIRKEYFIHNCLTKTFSTTNKHLAEDTQKSNVMYEIKETFVKQLKQIITLNKNVQKIITKNAHNGCKPSPLLSITRKTC